MHGRDRRKMLFSARILPSEKKVATQEWWRGVAVTTVRLDTLDKPDMSYGILSTQNSCMHVFVFLSLILDQLISFPGSRLLYAPGPVFFL